MRGAFSALLLAAGISWAFPVIYNFILGETAASFVFLAVSLGAVLLSFLLFRKYQKKEADYPSLSRDAETEAYLRRFSDRMTKRALNGIAIFFAALAFFTFSEALFYFQGNSKDTELLENVFSNSPVVTLAFFLMVKNLLLFRSARRLSGLPEKERALFHFRLIIFGSLAYWALGVLAFVLLSPKMPYPANLVYVLTVLYLLLYFLYQMTLRRRLVQQNIVYNPIRSGSYALVIIVLAGYLLMSRDTWYVQPYINSIPRMMGEKDAISYDEESAVYTITTDKEEFRVLQLTDIHLGGSLYSYRNDMKALEACFREIEYAKPDFVVVTGDLCFPLGIMSLSLNNSAPISQFAAFMRNLDVPWAFTYGNHDTENVAAMNKQDLNELMKSLSYKTSGTLLYPYSQPDCMGRNNQMIEIRNEDGSVREALFLIDSNAYTGEGINVYDYIHDDQVEWYASKVNALQEESGRPVPSMSFFHIPLQQYRTAYELYEANSPEVTYYFGENAEKMINKVCCSDYPSSLFDRMKELGSTKAVFCGHDHYNNMSLEYQGIRLTYGMSIDYLAMPGIAKDTAQRGGTLITIDREGGFEIEQIPYESIRRAKD